MTRRESSFDALTLVAVLAAILAMLALAVWCVPGAEQVVI